MIAGIDSFSIITEQSDRIAAIWVRYPQPVKVRRRTINIVPADIDNSAIVQYAGMPFVCFVKLQCLDVGAV